MAIAHTTVMNEKTYERVEEREREHEDISNADYRQEHARRYREKMCLTILTCRERQRNSIMEHTHRATMTVSIN